MSVSNRDRIRKGLDQTKIGLMPFVERELKAKLGGSWIDDVTNRIRGIKTNKDGTVHWDTQAILKAMVDNWQGVFRYVLGQVERNYTGELIDVRNRWAHENPFTSDDVYRALDTIQRLLQSLSVAARPDSGGELTAALQVFLELGLVDTIPLAGLAKEREELFVPQTPDPILLPRGSQGMFLVQRIRDEAHRFAITYHRQRRSKGAVKSAIDSVPGIGPKRRRTLIRRFGSVAGIKAASLEELASVPGMTMRLAQKIKEYL